VVRRYFGSYPSPFGGALSHVVYRWIRRSLGELGGSVDGMYMLAERTPVMGHTGWVDANRELHRETDGDAE
jgi:hypothetical protein